MNQKDMNEMMSLVQTLSETEKKSLIDKVMKMLQTPEKGNSCNDLVSEYITERPNCPHCHSGAKKHKIIKKGFKNGVQRYYCKDCGKFFVATTNTAFAYSRKNADTWREFIYLTMTGATLLQCAKKCKIAYQTAFTWRHKLLNVFAVHQNQTEMDGVIEMDEMLIPLNYKGNHVQGSFEEARKITETSVNKMPRPSYKRGTDNKSCSSKDKACVFCMIGGGDENLYTSVPGVGFMKKDMLNVTVAKHVKKETSFLLVDEYRVTKNWLEKNKFKHMSLISNTSENPHDHKPQIMGEYHLQHVNALHHHIHRFLKDYCGVSSKYLNNYVSMYVWLKTASEKSREKAKTTALSRAVFPDCYISRKELHKYPSVPQAA